jgi:hypothetical protein
MEKNRQRQKQIPAGRQTMGQATATAKANTNTGILHYVQDDDVKQARANAMTEADPCGMTNNGTGNGNGKYRGPSLRSG